MIRVGFESLGKTVDTNREMFHYTQNQDGPLLLVSAGVHGNEASGIIALDRVIKFLQLKKIPIRGSFVGLCGNLAALARGQRFIDQDLNRSWGMAELNDIRHTHKDELNTEQKEVREIIKYLSTLDLKKYERKWFIDCHTTSAESIPYLSVPEKPDSIEFARRFPTHMVIGFSDLITTTMERYLCDIDFNGFTLEAGQHDEISSVENCEALIFLALVESGCIHQDDLPCYAHCREVLQKFIFEDKKVFDIIYRHDITPESEFKMAPGFVNFQKIRKEEHLATDKNGVIQSHWDARIMFPLYQAQGQDGFFIIDEK